MGSTSVSLLVPLALVAVTGSVALGCGAETEPEVVAEAPAEVEPVPAPEPGGASPGTTEPPADPAPAGEAWDGEAVAMRRKPWSSGDRFESHIRMELKLDAEIGLGIFSQEVEYRMAETEVLAVEVLDDGDDGSVNRSLEYVKRVSTRVVPIKGKEQEERRTHGKTFTVSLDDQGAEIRNVASGNVPREKVLEEVLRSWRALGAQPVLFDAFPAGDPVLVVPGEAVEIEGEMAKRLVGLPFDELGVDSLELTLREPATASPAEVVFDARAVFSGSAELGDGILSLTAHLDGPITVATNSMRVKRVELKGKVKAKQKGEDATLSAKGSGPLSIKRHFIPKP